MSLAKEFRVAITARDVTFNQDLKALVPSKKLVPEFLFYYLLSQNQPIRDSASESGHGTKKLDAQVLEEWPLPLPDRSTQTKIAAILSAYDELIENNRRRIALLEKLVEEIYREWFVRFRFPGHEKVKTVKGIPETWSLKTIGRLCSKVTDGAHLSPAFFSGGKPMASVKDMHEHGFNLETVKTISENDFEALKRADCQPLKNDVLIAKDGSYLKHVFVWNYDYEIVILSSIAILRPNLSQIRPYFFAQVLKQDSTKTMMSGYVSGSALPRIILNDFKKMHLLIPTGDLIDQFEEVVAPIYESIQTAIRQNETLVTTRDKLLPRLISGRLSVEQLDIQFPPGMKEEMEAAA
jgi:type I restriction enzyme S subunit